MVGQHLWRDAEIGGEESRAQLGNKLAALPWPTYPASH
jgi:hypothetical protein